MNLVFWQQLGLKPGASRKEIKRAYYQLARRNHPDIYPEEKKAVQELKMIALNEAYACLMREVRLEQSAGRTPGVFGPNRSARATAAPQSAETAAAAPVCTVEVGFHKDISYAYYKQGFVHFSRAIQGIEALYQQLSRRRVVHFKPRDDAYRRFADGLVELRRAHEYFSRVVDDFEQSIWRRDAQLKLGRIERFSTLYRRILGNLSGGRATGMGELDRQAAPGSSPTP